MKSFDKITLYRLIKSAKLSPENLTRMTTSLVSGALNGNCLVRSLSYPPAPTNSTAETKRGRSLLASFDAISLIDLSNQSFYKKKNSYSYLVFK